MNAQFKKGVLWSVASLVILGLGGGAINLIIINMRDETALGIFNQVFALYIILSQIGVGGIQYSTLKQISYHQDDLNSCSEITNSALVLVAGLALIISISTIFLAEVAANFMANSEVGIGLKFVAPGLFFFALNKVLMSTLNGLNRMRPYSIFQSLRYILLPGFVLVFILFNFTDAQLVLALTFTEVILFLLLIIYIYRNVILFRRIDNLFLNLRDHFNFGIRSFMSGILTELNTRVDVLLLGYFLSDAYVGLYTFVAFIVEGVGQIAYAVRWNVDPILGDMFSKGQIELFLDNAYKIRNRAYVFIGSLGVLIIILYPILIGYVVPEIDVKVSSMVLIILMIGVVINSGYRPFIGLLLQGSKPVLHSLIMSILVINNILLNIVLIPMFGVYGSALATSSTFVLEAFLIYYFSKAVFNLDLILMKR
ncbi:MAG: lipopolysaccharide biosynthesis protein [Anaerolineales bacterium]